MCCGNNNQPDVPSTTSPTNGCGCLGDILEVILKLQSKGDPCGNFPEGCDRPFLGPMPNVVCYNTRPVTLYTCGSNTPWSRWRKWHLPC